MPKILLVDDEPELIELIKFRLEANDYEVITANDGVVCLNKSQTEAPDVILLDLVMPVMDGYEACRRLKQMPQAKDIPIILFTASDAKDIKKKVEDLGAFDYIVKPFEPEELLKRITQALKSRPVTGDR